MITPDDGRRLLSARLAMLPKDHPLGEARHIYALVDPRNDEIRYIGKTVRPHQRLRDHINDRGHGNHKSHWIADLRSQGLEPYMVLLETSFGQAPWQEAERHWIARGKELGWRLTNSRPGGDGPPPLPPETRERMAKAWAGRKHRPDSLAKMAAASRGRRHSAESKARRSEMFRGRKITWIGKISEVLRKLSADDIVTIRARLAAGDSVGSLAAEYGVHRTTMSKVKMGTYEVFGQGSKGGAA